MAVSQGITDVHKKKSAGRKLTGMTRVLEGLQRPGRRNSGWKHQRMGVAEAEEEQAVGLCVYLSCNR